MRSTSSRSPAIGPYRSRAGAPAGAAGAGGAFMAAPGTGRLRARPVREVSELSIRLEYYCGRPGASIRSPEGAAAAAALLLQPDALDGHNTVDGLAHVVDGEGGDADGGEGLHLDAGAAEDADGGVDAEGVVGGEGEVDGGAGEGEGVAEGDEVAGALGGHDAGEAGDLEDIALGEAPVADEGEGG